MIPGRHSGLRTTAGMGRKPRTVRLVEIHSGFRVMVVSIISTGAGSVAVSKRPSLPATVCTSGNDLSTRSCQLMISFTSVREVPGSSTGMNSRLPSLSGGMNSLPMP